MSFLPALSAYANYNLVYQNDQLNQLYARDFPNSSVGLKLTLPLFQGTKRMQLIKRAGLQYQQMALDTLNEKNAIHTEFTQAMASYKTNLKLLLAAEENARLAEDIYNTVKLQYDHGIKTYLEVIVSETDLRTARIDELDSVFRVLSSKLDVEKALGTVSVNY
jgi:outer membrane protein